jgi:hypothetical protein
MQISLGDFNIKIGSEDIFKPAIEIGCYTKLIMIKELEWYTLPRIKTSEPKYDVPTSQHT